MITPTAERDVVERLDERFHEIANYCARNATSEVTKRAPEHLALYQDAKDEITRLRAELEQAREEPNFDIAVDLVARVLKRHGMVSNGPVMLYEAHAAAILAERSRCEAAIRAVISPIADDTDSPFRDGAIAALLAILALGSPEDTE